MTEPEPQPDVQPSVGTSESLQYPAYAQQPAPNYGAGYPPYSPYSQPQLPPKKSNKGLIIGLIVGAVVLFGVVVVAVPLIFFGKVFSDLDKSISAYNFDTDQVLSQELEVTFGTFTVVNSEYRDETKLPVTFRNKGKARKSFTVAVEALNSSGDRIAQDTESVENLAPGQSTSQDMFTYIDETEISALTKATFKVFTATSDSSR